MATVGDATTVALSENSAAADVRSLLHQLCDSTSSELASLVADAHELLCAFTCEPGGTVPSVLAGTRSHGVQQWSVTRDRAGHVSGVRVELPLVHLGGDASVLPTAAAALFSPLWSLPNPRERQARREAQADGREVLHRLMQRAGFRHPHLCAIVGTCAVAGCPALVLECYSGGSLSLALGLGDSAKLAPELASFMERWRLAPQLAAGLVRSRRSR